MPLATLQSHPLIQTLAGIFADRPAAEAFVVGGVVRNALLDREFTDVDVVVRGLGIDELEAALAPFGSVDRVGRRFGVLKLTVDRQRWVDVALPRTEQSFRTGRRADFNVVSDPQLPIEEDLARRDFTVNAMAWSLKTQRLVDPYGGQADLASHLVRAVGDPAERFTEDATRMLRAVRFAVQLEFNIEAATAAAMQAQLGQLNDEQVTPREVVASELVLAFAANPVRAFDLWDEHGLTATLIPELAALKGCAQPPEYHSEGDAWTHTRRALEALTDPSFQDTFGLTPSPELIVATLLHDIGKPATQRTPERDRTDHIRFDEHAPVGAKLAGEICQRLKLPAAGIDCPTLVWLIAHHLDILNIDSMKATTLERTFLVPPERGERLQLLTWADSRASLNPAEAAANQRFSTPTRFPRLRERLRELTQRGFHGQRPALFLSGQEVMAECGLPSGPAVGRLLELLREAQLSGTVTTREQAIRFVRSQRGT